MAEIECGRFATCHDDRFRGILRRVLRDQLRRRERVRVGVPAFFHVAPVATHVAAAETNKIGRLAGVKTFALDGVKFFHQWQETSFVEGNLLLRRKRGGDNISDEFQNRYKAMKTKAEANPEER